MPPSPPSSAGRRGARLALTSLVLLAGAGHLALGLMMALAPRSFYEQIGAYPPFNDHYVRDVATFYVALGAVLLVAAGRRRWQVPLLAFATLQYGLHVLNHLLDVGDAEPGWLGPANLIALAAIGAGLLWLLRRAGDAPEAQPDDAPRGGGGRR
jgi:hypothetical protein